MRYAKITAPECGLYVAVEDRDGVLWAINPILPPDEDPMPSAHPAVRFRPAPLDSLPLCPPVRPSKIICVGRNYREHAAELGNEVPKEPLLFMKPPSSLLAPGGTVVMPALSKRVDFEGELAIVIGKRCRNIGPEEDVRKYIRGYTLVNDVTARDIQKSDGQWTRGKGWDTFCPTGPIVSDEIDPIDLPVTVTTRLNGELKTDRHDRRLSVRYPLSAALHHGVHDAQSGRPDPDRNSCGGGADEGRGCRGSRH